jgi:hypothetical protein
MPERSKTGLQLERLFQSMQDWEGRGLRHLLCFNGQDDLDSCFDCSCCITWPDDEMYTRCPCICHVRIEAIARSGDIGLLFTALAASDVLPRFPASFEEQESWRKENLETGRAHYHNTNGVYSTYPQSTCSVCCPAEPPHENILYDSKTGELLPKTFETPAEPVEETRCGHSKCGLGTCLDCFPKDPPWKPGRCA